MWSHNYLVQMGFSFLAGVAVGLAVAARWVRAYEAREKRRLRALSARLRALTDKVNEVDDMPPLAE